MTEYTRLRIEALRACIPADVQALPQWSPTYPRPAHGNAKRPPDLGAYHQARYKRPLIAAGEGDHRRLMTLDAAIAHCATWDTDHDYGVVTMAGSPLCVLDIDDYAGDATTDAARVVIERLARQTYTERSLSGSGLHVLLYIGDKAALSDRAYIKARSGAGWSGQLSLRNNYMICTGDRLPDSVPTVSAVDLDLLRELLPGLGQGACLTLTTQPQPADDSAPATTAPATTAPATTAPATTAPAAVAPAAVAPAAVAPAAVAPEPARVVTQPDTTPPQSASPEWSGILANLSRLTLDRCPRVVRAWETVTGTAYDHYDYWLRVGMGLHAEASRLGMMANGLQAYIDWSATDPTSYAGPLDVMRHWESFGDAATSAFAGRQPVTYATISALARRLVLAWPVLTPKGLPDQTALDNMRAMIRHYALQAYDWPGVGYLIGGDPDILRAYFARRGDAQDLHGLPVSPDSGLIFGLGGPHTDTLTLQMASLAQGRAGWRGKHSAYSVDLVACLLVDAKPYNPTYTWLTTDAAALPASLQREDDVFNRDKKATSTFDNLLKAFTFSDGPGVNVPLIEKMLRAMIMQLVRFADPASQSEPSEGMVILVGPEGCRKTSFFRWLYPPSLGKLHVQWTENAASDKNKRDMGRALSGAGVFLLDECDYILKGNDVASWLKAVLTNNVVGYTEIYGKTRVEKQRTALICGTTNNRDIWLSNSDNRRMWLIDVEYIDIEYLERTVSRYWLYRHMYDEYKVARARGEKPWIMDPQDFLAIRAANETMAAKSTIRMDLEDALDIDPGAPGRVEPMSDDELAEIVGNPKRPDHPHLCSTLRVKKELERRGVAPSVVSNTAQLKHALRRISENYTGHRKPVKICPRNAVYRYAGGEVYYGGRKAWLLPEWRELEGDL